MNKRRKWYLWLGIVNLLLAGILYYVFLPAINLTNPGFYLYLFVILISVLISFLLVSLDYRTGNFINRRSLNIFKWFAGIITFVFVTIILVDIVLSPIFNAKSYSKRISVRENASFSDEVRPVDFNSIPLLDKDSSQKLGDRVMGEMTDLVSQFYVSDLYTQINYNNDVVRVTPLEYYSVIKYFTNRSDGVKGYIIVNSVNGKSELVRLENGMKYMPSAMFGEDLYRKLRFSYPTEIFGDINFELDNDGNPYWVVSTIKYTGIGLREEISGVVILDPITGESSKYNINEVPTWVDHVYSADLIIEQFDDWGTYKNGFLNSIFGQKNVVVTTDGYNYLAMNDDIYLYTGVTSVVTDESNLGFILCNMRTKETVYYQVPGAEEYSAMDSAKGQVQQMNYTSTFPLLINLEGRPTYLISLKDNAGLVKMYAFVDVQDYQRVVVTDAARGINEAARNYLSTNPIKSVELVEKQITIKGISTANIDGVTYYYFVDNDNSKYKVSIKTNEDVLPFVRVGSRLLIKFNTVKDVTNILDLEALEI